MIPFSLSLSPAFPRLAQGEVIGMVTSGTMSPSLKIGIGMGYVKTEYAKIGTEIFVKVRNRNLKALVAKPPFRN